MNDTTRIETLKRDFEAQQRGYLVGPIAGQEVELSSFDLIGGPKRATLQIPENAKGLYVTPVPFDLGGFFTGMAGVALYDETGKELPGTLQIVDVNLRDVHKGIERILDGEQKRTSVNV